MPANPKYLSSRTTRWAKVSAAILGGYLATTSIHMAAGVLIEDKQPLVLTSIWSSWLMWVAFMVGAFMFKKGWHAWGMYLGIILVASTIIFLNK